MANRYKPMNRTELEIAGITGMWKGKHITQIQPLSLHNRKEIKDFIMIVHLYNAEVLDDMTDTQVAKIMLEGIGIECD